FVIDNEHFFQRTDVLGIARIHFHHHFILVHRLQNGRGLPLTEGVISQTVGGLSVDAQPCHGVAVVSEVHLRAVLLLIGVHVRQFRQRRQFFADFRLPFSQCRQVVG